MREQSKEEQQRRFRGGKAPCTAGQFREDLCSSNTKPYSIRESRTCTFWPVPTCPEREQQVALKTAQPTMKKQIKQLPYYSQPPQKATYHISCRSPRIAHDTSKTKTNKKTLWPAGRLHTRSGPLPCASLSHNSEP